jgi:hypothetical protein
MENENVSRRNPMKEVKFKTVLSTLKKGEKPCYRAVVNHNGTVDTDEIAKNAAARVGMDAAVMKFAIELFFSQMAEEMKNGNRLEIENILSGGIAVTGTFAGANTPWDKSKNALTPYFYAKGDMKHALDGVTAVNVTEGNHALLKRVVDTVAKTDGVITNQANITVYLSGTNLLLNAAASDEGVWLEDEKGVVVAKGNVTGSTSTTIDCTFVTLPKDGTYKIVVATRGGLGSEFGVSIARKSVEVKSAI